MVQEREPCDRRTDRQRSLGNRVPLARCGVVGPRMKRDESLKSITGAHGRSRRGSGQRPHGLGWRQNSLTISTLAQNSAYLTEKAYNES
ncbi:hypothetical protein EVAR_68682_1 [Eumeta japonica]|uniref:Uncharacterized protein n=1 Tax=Eumeta variegata TaxID=151549 RepID=A0A4C2AB34_EUMVA|nr:hypothetical protein EVAR_68682_1 [Eumeta japonica]